MKNTLLIAALIFSASLTQAAESNWPQCRGPSGSGVLPAQAPLNWGAEENIAWKVSNPGSGWSSPVVVGDRLFLTSASAEDAQGPVGFQGGVAAMRNFRNAKAPARPLKFKVIA